MKPLLNITNVPIAIEHKTTRAKLVQQTKQPRAEITRQKGGLDMRSNPAKVKMDSTEMRASMGLKTPQRFSNEFADTGKQDAREATEQLVQNGQYIADSRGGSPIADLAMSNSIKTYETALTFIPSTGPEMWTEGGELDIQYTADRLQFDWDVSTRPYLEYVPPNIEFQVTQYPQVVIEYLGGPMYVPPSSDPDYVPPPSIDVKG
ncbi:DUF6470 family protein [Ruminococcaceae bacterium OttesenSCG-928-L11]|nr:DUF6470 family protein [Ruminococcaceae bacterium OttesenSCG-928-L11]